MQVSTARPRVKFLTTSPKLSAQQTMSEQRSSSLPPAVLQENLRREQRAAMEINSCTLCRILSPVQVGRSWGVGWF